MPHAIVLKIVVTFALLAAASDDVVAQVQPASRFPRRSSVPDSTLPPPPRVSCPGTRAFHFGMDILGGAAAGWLLYTFGLGVVTPDRGEYYHRERRLWTRYGAAFGAVMGAGFVTFKGCDELDLLHPRTRRNVDSRFDFSVTSR